MNDVIKNINNRVSLRRYKDKEISKEHLDIIIDSAIKAPTAGNMMMYSILKITDEKLKETLSETCDNQPFIKNAKVILIFLADMQKWYDYFKVCNVENIKSPGMNDFMLGVNDALIACQNAVIAAESLGIGSCYIGDIMENYEKHKALLNLPDYTFPAAMITLGYYPENIKRVYRDRFDKEYVVFDNGYKRLDEDELKNMFKRKEENMPKTNTHDANNFGELMYIRKTSADFSIEMDRSIKEGIKHFTK
ncbi:nitroreductase family protein [Romboutsia sp.]|uniref:nitroreductase family protein n=1 Tax=Romboutsia sp. TaxID=1965302 RepID=UPI002CCE7C2D|nr:nitroreductase family protein [Romboutsia sp.]HSQ90301.1 nitroreductase family protein [Romboutsia sp.]